MTTHCNISINEHVRVSPDGYIRIPAAILESVQLAHLDSGIYSAQDQSLKKDRTRCTINGYTEWISLSKPCVSISWDWNLVTYGGEPGIIKTGDVYTNLMVQNDANIDLPERESLRLLSNTLAHLDWKSKVRSFITEKYAR